MLLLFRKWGPTYFTPHLHRKDLTQRSSHDHHSTSSSSTSSNPNRSSNWLMTLDPRHLKAYHSPKLSHRGHDSSYTSLDSVDALRRSRVANSNSSIDLEWENDGEGV